MIDVTELTLSYQVRSGIFASDKIKALDGLSFSVFEGETLGIIGRNGSGKSTLLRVLAGIYPPDDGKIISRAKSMSLMTLMLGFDPVLSGRDNALFGGMLLGFSKSQVYDQIEAIKHFSGLDQNFEKAVGSYSSGMVSRLSFSIAINLSPDVMLVDEVLAVGDEAFRGKAYTAMSDKISSNQTTIFVSHSALEIERLCDRVLLLEQGRLVAEGEPAAIIKEYRALLSF